MDELEKLYNVLIRDGKYTKSFDEFKSKWSTDNTYKDKVYDVVSRDGLYTKDKDSFMQKYSIVDKSNSVKKKDQSISVESGDGSKPFQEFKPGTGGIFQQPTEGSKPKPVQKKLVGKELGKALSEFKKPTFQELYNQDPGVVVSEIKNKEKQKSIASGIEEDQYNYYYNGAEFPKSEFTKINNTLIKTSVADDITQLDYWKAIPNEFNKAVSDFLVKPTAGGIKILRDLPIIKDLSDSIYQQTGKDPLQYAIDKLNETSDTYDYLQAKGGLSQESVAKAVIHAVPVIASIYATGGGSISKNVLGESSDIAAKQTLTQMAKKAAVNPLVKTLAATSGLSEYGTARRAGADIKESAESAISAGIEGAKSGLVLTLQGAISGRVTQDFMKSIYTGGLTPSVSKYVQGIAGGLNTALVFGATPIVNDLMQGKPADLNKAAHEFVIGLAFEAPKIAKGIGNLSMQPIRKYKLNESIFDTALGSKLSPRETGEISKVTLEDNAINNFFNSKPEAIDIANEIPATHQELFEQSLVSGEKAYEAKDLSEKTARHIEQLTMQKASDIKYVTDAILKNKESFIDAVNEMDIPSEQKSDYIERINDVYERYSEAGRINKTFDLAIETLNKEISDLTNKSNSSTKPSEKASIDAKIKDRQQQLTELQNALNQFAVSQNKSKEDAYNRVELNKKIGDFVEKVQSGEDISSPEDMRFYENNKKEIERRLKDAIQEPSAESQVSPAGKTGEIITETGERVRPIIEGKETPKEAGKEKITESLKDVISQLESVKGKQKKIDLVDRLKSISTPEEFDAFLEKNPKYKKYVSEKPSESKIIEEERESVFNSAKEKAMSAISKFKEGLEEGKASEKEKAKSLSDIVDGLREEIKLQLSEAKTGALRSGKIPASAARGIMNRLNNAKTPMQILSAIDYIEKSLQDIDYGRKLSESNAIAKSLKKLLKDAPLNIRIALNTLTGSSPKEISDVNDFLDAVSSASEFLKQKTPEGINQKQILDLASRIQKNNLKSRIDRATDILARKTADKDAISSIESERKKELSGVKSRAERKSINDKYNAQINEVINQAKDKIRKPISDSISEMKESLDELNGMIGVLRGTQDVGESGTKKREALESINESLKYELEFASTDGLSDKKKEMVDALSNIDTERLTDKQLKFLNYAISNFVENNSFDGVGQYIYNQYKIQKSFTPNVIERLKKSALGMNKFKRSAFTRTSVDTFLNSAFANEQNVALFRSVTGFGAWSNSYGAKTGFKGRLKRDMEYIAKVAEDTGVIKDPKSQIKLGATMDIIQHEKGLSEVEIQAEFEGRKEAMVESIRRGEDGLRVGVWANEYADYVSTMKEVYNEYVKDSNTPQELMDKLTPGEKKLMDAMFEKWESIKEGQRELSEIHKNEPFNESENYHARTYIQLYEAKVKTGDESIDITDSSGFRIRENLDKTKSTAFENRVLKGAQVRARHILNYNILDSFQNEYRKQLYDYYTYENRQYLAQSVSSPEMLESIGGDIEMLDYMQRSFSNRYLNEIRGLQAGKETGIGDELWNLARNSLVRDALGGFSTPFLKQFAPTMASVAVNSPETLLSSIWTIANSGKDFSRFISQSPVSLRHDQEVAVTGGIVTAKDLKRSVSSLKRAIIWTDKMSDKLLMTALKSGDQSSAGIAYLSYYQKSLLQQGKIKSLEDFDIGKEADKPDMIAQQYAEQMTSTTLNINEAVNKPVDSSVPLLKSSLPFTSFALNSKINLLNNIGKLAESNGVMSSKDRMNALQRIGSNIAEAGAINAIGWMIRSMSYAGAYSLFSYSLSNSDMDEKLKGKSLDILQSVFDNVIESNDKNSWNYFVNDVLFGQIGENFTKPIISSVSAGYNELYSASKGEQKQPSEYVSAGANLSAILTPLGYKGMFAAKSIKYMSDLSTNITYYNDPLFRLNKFGYINAYGDKVIPYEEQNTSVPAFNKYMQTMSVLSNTLGLVTGSPKEFQDFTRRIPKINKSIVTGLYGKDRTIFTESERYKRMEPVDFNKKLYYINDEQSNITISDNDYVLDTDQLLDRQKIKQSFLDSVYNNYMKKGVAGFSMVRSALEDQVKNNPESSSLKKTLSQLKYVGEYTNDQINNIADEISKYRVANKYINKETGKVNLKLKSEIKSK